MSDQSCASLANNGFRHTQWRRDVRVAVWPHNQAKRKSAKRLVESARNIPAWLIQSVNLELTFQTYVLNDCSPQTFIPPHDDDRREVYEDISHPRSRLNPVNDWMASDSSFLNLMLPVPVGVCLHLAEL